MHHPSIVTLIGFSTSPRGEIILMTELCDTDLMQLLERWTQNCGCNDPAAAVHLGKQVASAMSFLHSKGIIHGDIKVCAVYVVGFATPAVTLCSVLIFLHFAVTAAPEHFGERPGGAAHL
jgi:serine/threonine protein kinase